jgi:hypothetical protein
MSVGSASPPEANRAHPSTTASLPRLAHSASMLSRGVSPQYDRAATTRFCDSPTRASPIGR